MKLQQFWLLATVTMVATLLCTTLGLELEQLADSKLSQHIFEGFDIGRLAPIFFGVRNFFRDRERKRVRETRIIEREKTRRARIRARTRNNNNNNNGKQNVVEEDWSEE